MSSFQGLIWACLNPWNLLLQKAHEWKRKTNLKKKLGVLWNDPNDQAPVTAAFPHLYVWRTNQGTLWLGGRKLKREKEPENISSAPLEAAHVSFRWGEHESKHSEVCFLTAYTEEGSTYTATKSSPGTGGDEGMGSREHSSTALCVWNSNKILVKTKQTWRFCTQIKMQEMMCGWNLSTVLKCVSKQKHRRCEA